MHGKIFEGEIQFRTYPTIALQILCNLTLSFKVIFKSVIDPDKNFNFS